MDKNSNNAKENRLSLKMIIFIIVVFVFAGIAVINGLFHIPLIDTEWGGGDALTFFGSIFSGVGTIILGVVAWKQNERLLVIEEDNYLYNNTCAILITKIDLDPHYHRVTGLDSYSGLVLESNVEDIGEVFDKLHVYLFAKNLDSFPAFVRMDSLYLRIEDNENYIDISAIKDEDSYAVVSNNEDGSIIECVIKVKQGYCKAIREMWDETSCDIIVDAHITLVTNKYVASEVEVRTSQKVSGSKYNGERNHKEDKYEDIEKPMLLWIKSTRLDREQMTIKGLEKKIPVNSKVRKIDIQ